MQKFSQNEEKQIKRKIQKIPETPFTICSYRNCDVIDIILRNIVPIMQVLSVKLPDYNMQLKTTKCLNTAVMLSYILSHSKNMKRVEYCSVSKINKRYEKSGNERKYILKVHRDLERDLLNKRDRKRYFYYILITNYDMKKRAKRHGLPYDNSGDDKRSFPGHVFIIDKFPATNNSCNPKVPIYRIYQSYINQYDFNGYKAKNGNKLKLNDPQKILDGLYNIVSNDEWNKKAVKFWKDFTFVDTDDLVGFETKGLNLCYQKIQIDYCYERFYKFVDDVLKELRIEIEKGNKDTFKLDIELSKNLQQLSITQLYTAYMKMHRELGIKILANQQIKK